VAFKAVDVGVPLITPVDIFNVNPAGRLGETAYVIGEVPPEKLTGENEVTGESLYTFAGTLPLLALNAGLTESENVEVTVEELSVTVTV
jgi:hypothetical protein